MMLKKLCIVLSLLVAPIGSANATIYYDAASWLAAINALGPVTLGPYTGNVTFTDLVATATVSSHDGCCTIVDETATTSPGTFDNFFWQFNQIGYGLDACSDCTVTAPFERIVHFNPGIAGFYSLDALFEGESSDVGFLNGETITQGLLGFGFFGWVGSTTSLVFSDLMPPDNAQDLFAILYLRNIQVAILVVDEPSALQCLLAGLALLGSASAGLSLRRRREGVIAS